MPTDKKIALITGANKGIGFETARELGEAGWTVLLGARNADLGRAAESKLRGENVDAHFVPLEVTDAQTISAAAAKIQSGFARLDALVNNAGIVDKQDGRASVASVAGVERVMQTNFFGVVAVTQAMLPLLRKSKAARIINVSSGLGSIGRNANPPWESRWSLLGYCSSKAALSMFTVQLAVELKEERIAVNAVNPGYTATDINDNRGTQSLAEGAAEIVRLALLEDGPTGGFFETAGPIPW
jgi:NAD(P)-dependent dehydrogenase (short-subunit alcohol dehydrogenase family)